MAFFRDLRELARKLASLFGHPKAKSLLKFNLRPLANTCRSVWPGLKANKKSEGSENVTGLKFANRTRTQSCVRSPI